MENHAIERLRNIVGSDYVQTDEANVNRYSRDTIPFEKRCCAVVFPNSEGEVSQILAVATEYKIPVWPFSCGKNWGYGATMAMENHAIILVLERMNRIIVVDEEVGYVVLEPGVTQRQLYDHLKKTGSRLWPDCTDSTPYGSVLGNALERGVGYTPMGDHYGALCGLDVVLPDGSLLKTGPGPDHHKSRHTYKYGIGPIVEGLFSQSNFGIVVRGAIWLMPKPEDFAVFTFRINSVDKLPDILTAIRELTLNRLVNCNIHMGNDVFVSTILEQFPDRPGKTGKEKSRLDEREMEALRRKYHLARWQISGAVYGTVGQVRIGLREVRKRLRSQGQMFVLNDRRIGMIQKLRRCRWFCWAMERFPGVGSLLDIALGLYPVYRGEPIEMLVRNMEYYKAKVPCPSGDVDPCRDGNGTGLLWFPPLAPLKPESVQEILSICGPLYEQYGFNQSVAIVMVNPRTAIVLHQIFFDKTDPEETGRARALHRELMERCLSAGFQQYRTSVACMETILDSSPEYRDLLVAMKKAVDPWNIIAPGRYGVGVSEKEGP